MLGMKTTFTQLFTGLGILLLVALCLQQQIITTIFWYKVAHEARENPAVTVTPLGHTLSLRSTTSTQFSTHGFYNLNVPLIFADGRIKEDSGTVLAIVAPTSTKAYSVWRGAKLAHEFLIDPRRTTEEIDIICTGTGEEFALCKNNYQFLTNTLTATPKSAGLFSTRETKIRNAMYLLMKQSYVDTETSKIIPLTLNDTVTGYLLYAGSTATALVFENDNYQQPYQFVFSNMTAEEIHTVLKQTIFRPDTSG